MRGTPEWQYCDCASAEDIGESCGCGEPHLKANERVIHWRDGHWRIDCSFNYALMEADEMRQQLVKVAMNKIFQRRRNPIQDFIRDEE